MILTFNQQIVALGSNPLPDKDTMKVSFDYEGKFFLNILKRKYLKLSFKKH